MQFTKRAKNCRWTENPGSTEHLIETLLRNHSTPDKETTNNLEHKSLCGFDLSVDGTEDEIEKTRIQPTHNDLNPISSD